MKAVVNVFLKNGVLDSQGKAVHHALSSHGFGSVHDVRVGKQIIIEMGENNAEEAKEKVAQMCEDLLANTVIEDYTIEMQA
ncbi:MAG: phosphoribosylformylglycinamidine synthase subunit PurS [Sulfuricurvum sp.]|jgi:phosphoribosylformylglycinamidine synthase|uniref:phosphoribosylformylglycinamidine synthase subunit PurS n=1 Tax=Sulfuricurvum sp. TaxID=2025608 RepID=UPI0025E46E62|nr:phosphoribosylformylglycinamidine synthase subunit PurS [Sulfuricurvum sp.]MCK9373179.1 phosphoribosylformylglycinamidine synthase subunit PurS [Sulfuricurvum sp.]